jgi:hypothetical protein
MANDPLRAETCGEFEQQLHQQQQEQQQPAAVVVAVSPPRQPVPEDEGYWTHCCGTGLIVRQGEALDSLVVASLEPNVRVRVDFETGRRARLERIEGYSPGTAGWWVSSVSEDGRLLLRPWLPPGQAQDLSDQAHRLGATALYHGLVADYYSHTRSPVASVLNRLVSLVALDKLYNMSGRFPPRLLGCCYWRFGWPIFVVTLAASVAFFVFHRIVSSP